MVAALLLPKATSSHPFFSAMPSPQGTRWCFTINNPSEDDKTAVADLLSGDTVRYGVVGREQGESGTPHLQGFVIFRRNIRIRRLTSFLRRAHLELARGATHVAAEYCKKEGDFDEYGEVPPRPGQQLVVANLVQWGDEFQQENGRPPTSPEVARAHPTAYLRYPRVVRLFEARATAPTILSDPDPRLWQVELRARVEGPADTRSIEFHVDTEGGKGKTWFQQWMISELSDSVQILSSGKRDDLAHVIDPSKRIFLFNIARGQMEYFQYSIAENLKDQLVFSPKYNSRMKFIRHRCHVIVFCNEYPDMNKLSADRVLIYDTFN